MFVVIERNAHFVGGHEHSQLAAMQAMVPDTRFELLQAEGVDARNAILASDREVRKEPDASLRQDISAVSSYLQSAAEKQLTIIVPNANAYEVRLVLALIPSAADGVRFVLRLLRPEDIGSLDEKEIDALRQATVNGEVGLHTETVELKDFLLRTYDVQAEDNFLLPCTLNPDFDSSGKQDDQSGPYLVGFLGVPRREKGRKMIPQILQAIRELLPDNHRPIQLIMQRPRRSGLKLAPWIYEMRCNRAAGRTERLSISWKGASLSDDEFRKLFTELDLLLLPYDINAYAHRGSGMIIDSVLAGVPCLHTKGMAMANFLKPTGSSSETATDFGREIVRLAGSGPREASDVADAREYLLGQLERTRKLLVGLDSGGCT